MIRLYVADLHTHEAPVVLFVNASIMHKQERAACVCWG
jgi:hypothetical protein